MALTLREYTIGFLLFTMVLGISISTQSSFLNAYDTDLNESGQDTLKELKQSAEDNKLEVTKVKEDAGNVQTQLGVIGIGARIAKSVLSGIGNLPEMAEILITDLNFSPFIVTLFAIPVAAVIWEVISYIRQYRT
jgi:uncharacterized membrane protein YdfJ with MMPL/SSD domain